MLSIDERARKILENVYDFEIDDGKWALKLIADELRAVQREAFEKAAEIAEKGPEPWTPIRVDDIHNDIGSAYLRWVAERIRKEAIK